MEWVMEIRQLCIDNNVAFWFKQTGAKLMKDGKVYTLGKGLQHSQARKAGLNIKQKDSKILDRKPNSQNNNNFPMDFRTKLSTRIGMNDIQEIINFVQGNDNQCMSSN